MAEFGTNCTSPPDPKGMRLTYGPGHRLRELAARLASPVVRKGFLALLDQVIVSGTRFFTTVLVGRICGAEELGIYSLAFTFVVIVHGIQESLILIPYTVYGNQLTGAKRARYAGNAILQSVLLSCLAMILFVGTALLLSMGIGPASLPPVMWVLVGMIPLILLREFGRRFAFAHLRVTNAIMLDSLASAVQIGGLLWLATTGGLSAKSAYVVIGLACGVAGIAWIAREHDCFQLTKRQFAAAAHRNWNFGRWVFAGQTTTQITWYSIHWLIVFSLGTAATGVFAACMTLVFLSNPFILGLNNLLAPYTARAFAEGGKATVRRVVGRAMLFMTAIMVLFCGAVALLGEWLMRVLYDGGEYSGHMLTLNALALSIAVLAINLPVDNGLWAIKRAEVNFKASLLGLVATLFVALLLVGTYGMAGAAVSLLVGGVVESIVRMEAFFRLVGGDNERI